MHESPEAVNLWLRRRAGGPARRWASGSPLRPPVEQEAGSSLWFPELDLLCSDTGAPGPQGLDSDWLTPQLSGQLTAWTGLPGLLSGWTPAQVSLTAPHPHGAGLVVRWAEAMTPPCSSLLFPKGGIQPSSAILSLMLPVNYEVKHQEHPGHYSGLEVGGMPVVGKVLEQWGQESTFSLVWLSRHELPFWR